jgi:hypothetical protein
LLKVVGVFVAPFCAAASTSEFSTKAYNEAKPNQHETTKAYTRQPTISMSSPKREATNDPGMSFNKAYTEATNKIVVGMSKTNNGMSQRAA